MKRADLQNLVSSVSCRIGLCIARRLAEDGAKVVVSSRNQEHVDSAVKILRNEPGNLNVEGIVCNVGSYEHTTEPCREGDSCTLTSTLCFFSEVLVHCFVLNFLDCVKIWTD